MKEYKPFKSGKVRELYDLGDSLIMVCTDRISAFDNILENPIPKKGEVLNKMSKFWFDFTKDVVPNHMISIDAADMPVFFRKATKKTAPSAVSVCRKGLRNVKSSLKRFSLLLPKRLPVSMT